MKKITSKKIGTRINTLLADKGMKQKDLAKELGVTDNTVSYYASGERTPNIEQLIKICEIFDVSSDYILGLSDVQTRNETIQGINEKTGLSGQTIAILQVEKTSGNTAFADFLDYIIKKPELLMRCITAIHTKNRFESSPCNCHMDIDGNDIEMSMRTIYKTYMDETFEQITKGFSLEGEDKK